MAILVVEQIKLTGNNKDMKGRKHIDYGKKKKEKTL